MGKITFSKLAGVSAFLALLFITMPAYSQCPPGWETDENECETMPADMLEKHPADLNLDIIEKIIDRLREEGRLGGDCSNPPDAACEGNCGPGLVVEEAARLIPGARTFRKTYGKACNNHSIDVIIFPDGYAFDVIIDAGGKNLPAWNPLCPDPNAGDPGEGEPGACGPEDTSRRDFVLQRLNATDTPDLEAICNEYDSVFTDPPQECATYPDGPYIGILEWYYALKVEVQQSYPSYPNGPYPPPYPPNAWEFILRVCTEEIPWPEDYYCRGNRTDRCTP